MKEHKIFEKLLQLNSDWQITNVEIKEPEEEVHVYVSYKVPFGFCVRTGEHCMIYDLREEKVWRHLDTMEYKTYIHCRIPRTKNSLGEIASIEIPWAESGERHTHKFENLCIRIMRSTHNQTQTGVLLDLSYEKITRIMKRGVNRGIERRELHKDRIPRLCIDEKSYGKNHKYISVLSDPDNNRVLDVIRDRTAIAAHDLLNFTLTQKQLKSVKVACCDMWDPFILAIKKTVLRPKLYLTNFMLSVI